jgi:serine/threonine protein phosphatase PrpC
MKCPACGRENRTNAGFCAWCGARFAQAEAEPPAMPPASEEQSPAAPPPSPPPEAPALASGVSSTAPTVKLLPASAEAEAAPAAGPEATPAPVVAAALLRPGDILAERYEIVEVVESTPERNQYRARDPRRCAACGNDDNAPTDEFCRDCGASLQTPAYVNIVEVVHKPPEQYDLHFKEDERDYYATAEPPKPPEQAPVVVQAAALRLIWGRTTDVGKQRDHNEDALEAWLYARGSGGLLGLFIVADGLGGQDSGEVASHMATDAVWQALRASVWEPIIRGETPAPDALEQSVVVAVQAANKAVYEARQARGSEMSTTVTLALVVNDQAYIANVGDSRTYLFDAQGLHKITKDHSLVQRLVDTGQIKPAEVYTHPQRNLIYQSIGDRPEVRVDTFRHALVPDDRLILCSDGLWEMVREEGLEEVLMAETDPQRACDLLVRNANLAGGEDNISIIVVQALKA